MCVNDFLFELNKYCRNYEAQTIDNFKMVCFSTKNLSTIWTIYDAPEINQDHFDDLRPRNSKFQIMFGSQCWITLKK